MGERYRMAAVLETRFHLTGVSMGLYGVEGLVFPAADPELLPDMNPFLVFVLLVLGLPTLEIYLLIRVGSQIGAAPTVLLVVFTAVVGALLVRHQGLGTLMRVRQALDRGEVPAMEVLEGVFLLAAGLMLLIPGFFTDLVGFALLIPGLRRALVLGLIRRGQSHPSPAGPEAPGGKVIEGEFRRESD